MFFATCNSHYCLVKLRNLLGHGASIGEAGARVAEISPHPAFPKGSPELKWLIPIVSEPRWKRSAMVQ